MLTEQEARALGWPYENVRGSTFSYLNWSIYRDSMLEEGHELSFLRPFDWSPPEEEPAENDGDDFQSVNEDDEEWEEIEMSDSPHEETAMVVRTKPNDLLSESLRQDLKSLRKGQITKKDARWKSYGFPELSFALRRGSTAMHIHMMSAVANRFQQVKCDTLRKMTLIAVRAELTQIHETGSFEHVFEETSVKNNMVMSYLLHNENEDVRQAAGNALAELPTYLEEELQAQLREAQEQIDAYKRKIRELQHQNPHEFEDPVARAMRNSGVKEKFIRARLAQRMNAALTNISRANIRAKRRAMLEDAWSAWHDAPPEGFHLEFDPRRKKQREEEQQLLRSNPSWRLPLPQTYHSSSSSHEVNPYPVGALDIVDASIGFDEDTAEDFEDEFPAVPKEWDIQKLREEDPEDGVVYTFQSNVEAKRYGIEDDVPQEAPRVARRPPMDKRDVSDMGTEKEKTAPWRKGKHAFEDVDGRFYAAGKSKVVKPQESPWIRRYQ